MKALFIAATLIASFMGTTALANQGDGHKNDNDFWIEWNCKQAGGYWDGFECNMDQSQVICYARSARGQTYGVRALNRNASRAQRAAINHCEAASGHACHALGCVED